MAQNQKTQVSGPYDRLVAWVEQLPADFGKVRYDVHYWIWTPISAAQLAWVAHGGRLGLLPALGMLLGGALLWTFVEYLAHRFSFHSKSDHPLIKPFNSGLHLVHHKDPSSVKYVASPVVTSPFVYAVVFGFSRLVTGSVDGALVMVSGFTIMFMFYEYAHYSAHLRNPKTGIGRYLKKHHMLHHFSDAQNLFGVTTPMWDWVFGTHKAKRRGRGVQLP